MSNSHRLLSRTALINPNLNTNLLSTSVSSRVKTAPATYAYLHTRRLSLRRNPNIDRDTYSLIQSSRTRNRQPKPPSLYHQYSTQTKFDMARETEKPQEQQQQQQQQKEQEQEQEKEPLALPSTDSSDTTKLDVSSGSSTTKLDHLGPLVVNQDGTLSRITNWPEMSEIEKRNTLRVLGKRNQLRTAKLKEDATGSGGGGGEKGSG